MPTPIERLQIKGLEGGLNTEADEWLLEPTESPDCLNVNFGLRGEVSSRKGRLQTAVPDVTTPRDYNGGFVSWFADDPVWGLYDSTINQIFIGTGTVVGEGVGIAGGTTERNYRVANSAGNGFLYLSRADTTATPYKFDGTTLSVLTATIFDGTASRFPRAKTLEWQHERMFAANVYDGTNWFTSRIHFSNLLDPETWAALDFIDVSPNDDQEIQRIITYGDAILVIKDRSSYLLSGVSAESFTLFPLDSNVGTTSPDTVVVDAGRVFLFDPRRGVYVFDGESFTVISDKIKESLITEINNAYAYKAHGAVYNGRYYLSIPTGVATENNVTYVFDMPTGSWTKYDYGITSSVVSPDNVFYGMVDDSDDLQRLEFGTQDDGLEYTSYVKTAWLRPYGEDAYHRLRRVDWTFASVNESPLTINMRRNGLLDTYVSQTLTPDTGGAIYGTDEYGAAAFGVGRSQSLVRTTGWGKRWRSMQFELTQDAGTFYWNGATLHISGRSVDRGEI